MKPLNEISFITLFLVLITDLTATAGESRQYRIRRRRTADPFEYVQGRESDCDEHGRHCQELIVSSSDGSTRSLGVKDYSWIRTSEIDNGRNPGPTPMGSPPPTDATQ